MEFNLLPLFLPKVYQKGKFFPINFEFVLFLFDGIIRVN